MYDNKKRAVDFLENWMLSARNGNVLSYSVNWAFLGLDNPVVRRPDYEARSLGCDPRSGQIIVYIWMLRMFALESWVFNIYLFIFIYISMVMRCFVRSKPQYKLCFIWGSVNWCKLSRNLIYLFIQSYIIYNKGLYNIFNIIKRVNVIFGYTLTVA